MPQFKYEAKKGPKEIINGVIEAPSQNAAIDKLAHMGYVPIRVTPTSSVIAKGKPRAPQVVSQAKPQGVFSTKVKGRDITIFTEQLASLMKARVPLLEAMKVLHDQSASANLKRVLGDIRKEIRDGQTLSHAMGKYPKVFPPLYVNMVNSGESGGVLDKTLLRLSEFRNAEEEFRAKVVASMAYPIFIVLVGIATVFVLLGFVIPRMASLFGEMGQTLPAPTRILLSISDKVKNYWYIGALFIAAVVTVLKRSSTEGRKEKIIIDKFKLKIPIIGEFIKKTVVSRFSRTLGLLIANGIPVFQAIKITIPTIENDIFKEELQKVHKNIIDGMSLEQSLRSSLWFPQFMTNMLAVGERGGSLEDALNEVAEFYERDVDKTTKVITSLIEPAIILAMGLVVGFIVFAMLLPIFQLNLGMN